jgi:hypothetical protein
MNKLLYLSGTNATLEDALRDKAISDAATMRFLTRKELQTTPKEDNTYLYLLCSIAAFAVMAKMMIFTNKK